MAYGLLYDFLYGQTIDSYKYFGAHFEKKGKENGVTFRLYAPGASDVSVIGEWNNWDVGKDKLHKIDDAGVWEIFIPNLSNYQSYKYHFRNAQGTYVDKADPWAFFSELRPNTCSRLFNYEGFPWGDEEWMKGRTRNFDKAMSIYEMHIGSWIGHGENDRYFSYDEIADKLVPYLKGMGYTHVEFMPLIQHPFDGSWGYQATGFYSVDSRYGNPHQLMSLINKLHEAGIGVILDFAPVHFATDSFALINFDGAYLFESSPSNVSPWGSCYFDLGKDPVRSFLMSAMNYFVTEFHVDGIRVDAVSNMLYYEGNKSIGRNEGAIEFLKRLTCKIHDRHWSVMMIAEDSSDFPRVTKPTTEDGIGFDYKWDLGWMNDTLKYYSKDPIYKKYEHNKLTFSMAYYFNENFLLPFSHDEVVHGKGTLMNKLWGDYVQKFMQYRNLLTYQYSHPGKKLNFMGNELGTFDEWNEVKSLAWNLKQYPMHDCLSRMIHDLNEIYKHHSAMYLNEYNPNNFKWLMVDNADQSVFAFERFNEDERLLFVFNMTSNYYDFINIPVTEPGYYEEIFNSDKDIYSGSNQYNGAPLTSSPGSFEGLPYHVTMKLASFGACIFKYRKFKEVDESKDKQKAKSGGKRGLLLAVSSLPGRYGIGDFSEEAFEFIRILKKNKINVWQILPLNPIGYGHSPYQPFSSYAFDEIYISIEDLRKRGLIPHINRLPSKARTNFEVARKIKEKAIYLAYENFKKDPQNLNVLRRFIDQNPYIREYAEFLSLKELNDGKSWSEWKVKKEDKMDDFVYLVSKHAFAQMILLDEWDKIRKYANKNGIEIVGDVPFYVGYDSSDVYFHRESFLLDEKFRPTKIAGVPPDYFSKDGQRWGNPIWNWEYLYKNDFKAMMDRLAYASKIYDIVRLDHFRAFDSYWEINPSCKTAVDGEWKFPNGYAFFGKLYEKYPNINLIVEDLGDLRPEVLVLRDAFGLPGMRELEFTIGDDELNGKHLEVENMIYYTSTHDNETLLEWTTKLTKKTKEKLLKRMNELGMKGNNLTEKLVSYALKRKEKLVVVAVQDLLVMDKRHRMNEPGIVNETNWTFKLINFDKLEKALKRFY